MYYLTGCPMHYGVNDKGLIHSLDYLCNNHKNLNIHMIPEVHKQEEHLPALRNLNSVVATNEAIAQLNLNVLTRGKTPIFIGGDHSIAIGTVSASSTYVERKHQFDSNENTSPSNELTKQQSLGLIWIDAHPDINTDETTITGNIHGMPVAALIGRGEQSLTKILTEEVKLNPKHIVYLALRDIDPPEAEIIQELEIRAYTYEDVKRRGLPTCLYEIQQYLTGLEGIHISFDIDSMDPKIMPGVSVPVPDGLGEEDVYQIFRHLVGTLPITAIDIVEYNMEHDINEKTSDFVSDLVEFISEL